MNLFRTKSVADEVAKSGLRKVLGPVDLTLMGIGCIIGAGIFVLTGQSAALYAGPAIVLSFVLSGVACACAGLAYAELASTIGGCGSAYGYGYATLGELIGWIIGWDLILEYGAAASTVAVGWSGYMNNFLATLGISLPASLQNAPGSGGSINLMAVVIILLLTVLLALGAKVSARFNGVMVGIKLLVLLLFIVVAIPHVVPANWHPFIPAAGTNTMGDPAFGLGGIGAGAATIFFAYIGFDSVSTAAEETANPQRNVPIGIIASLVICTALYMVVSLLLTGLVPYQSLNTSAPVSDALLRIGMPGVARVTSIGAIAGLTTVMLVLFFGLTRIFFAMSRDGLLPAVFSTVNERTGTPVRVIVVSGLIMAILAGFVPLSKLTNLVNLGTLGAFVVVCAGVIWLRYNRPELHRPFRTPWFPVIPIAGILFCCYLIYKLPVATWIAFSIWLALGMVIYFGYSYRNSGLAKQGA
jgi:APA family basic amino acid/polyamine antiporter